MIYYPKGVWSEQDIRDFEDCIDMWRFEIRGNTIRVKTGRVDKKGEHMTERLIEKIDRIANEAGIKEVTPEIRRFAMLVRQDVVAQWPKQTDVLWASTSAMSSVENGHLVATYLSRRFIEDEYSHPLYSTPQQRAWVDLTDEQIEDCYKQGGIGRAIQMLKEKNT